MIYDQESLKIIFEEIKEAYYWFTPKIFERYNKTENPSRWVDPYILSPRCHRFSHIERITWGAIRYYGHAPFYPQYPVGKYFVDFGNPIVKVGIECDGKEFHADKEKDLARDTELFNMGWNIYRISGADCNRTLQEDKYPDEYINFSDTIDGLIECLAVRYFNQIFYGNQDHKINQMCHCLSNRISIKTNEWVEELCLFVVKYLNKPLNT